MADPECFVDQDCPAPLLCYANVSWSEVEAFCGCSSWYGHAGSECKEFNATFFILVATNALLGVIAGGCSVFGIVDIVRTVRLHGFWLPLTASNTTMLFCTAGVVCQTIWMLAYTIEAALVDTYTDFSGVDRVSTVTVVTRVVIVLVQVFAFLSSLNVSVMWIELSQRARSMSPKMVQNVSKYRRACIGTGSFFTLLMILAMALGHAELGAMIAMPFIFVLAVVFLVGRLRMVSLLNEAISRSKESSRQELEPATTITSVPASQVSQSEAAPVSTTTTSTFRGHKREKTAEERTRRTRHAIKRCSSRVISALFCIVVSGFIYFALLTLPKGGWHEISPVGKLSAPALGGQLLPMSMTYLLVSIFLYSHRNTNKLLRRARGLPTSSVATASSKNDHDHTDVGSSFQHQPSVVVSSFVADSPPADP